MPPREQEQSSRLRIFILTKKEKHPRRSQKNIKPSVSSQLHAAVLLQAVEYCASPSNCCGFRDFSRFFISRNLLELCQFSPAEDQTFVWISAHHSLLWWSGGLKQEWVSAHLKAEPAMDLPGLRSWRRQNPDMLIRDWCYCSPFLESLQMCCKSWQNNWYHVPLSHLHYRIISAVKVHCQKKENKIVSFSAEHTGPISVGLIARRKEMFKLKTKGFATHAWEKRSDTEHGREMEKKWFVKRKQSFYILSLLSFHDGTP